jgi:hypothetical protein
MMQHPISRPYTCFPIPQWEEDIFHFEAIKSVDSIHKGGAQIKLGPCGPKQVILLTESGSPLAEDRGCSIERSDSPKGLNGYAPIRCVEI